MSRPSPEQVHQLIADFFSSGEGGRVPVPRQRVSDDFDVIADGGLDSLGFLELLSRLEGDLDVELDLADAPDGELTLVRTLVRFAVAEPSEA